MFHFLRSGICVFFATTLLLIGCGRSPTTTAPPAKVAPPPSVSVSVTGWGQDQHEQADLPGIDLASIVYYSWNDDIALAIWTDGPHAPSEMGKSLPRLFGRFELDNGRPDVKYVCTTDDGKNGTLTVHDRSLDLANGWLILVSTSNEEVRVKQVTPTAFRRIQGDKPLEIQINEYLASLNDDSSIVKFFRDSKTQDLPK